MYDTAEDSFLVKKHIKDYAKGTVLDLGTGSGILAVEASRYAEKVIGVDIDQESVDYCNYHHKGIEFRKSDLYSDVSGKFDLIIFNPPYLPEDKDEPMDSRRATTGGKHGYEIIKDFLKQAKHHLKKDGKILLLFSSMTNIDKVQELNDYDYKEIDRQHIFFEDLILYELQPKSA